MSHKKAHKTQLLIELGVGDKSSFVTFVLFVADLILRQR
jgi:hypothetical protein